MQDEHELRKTPLVVKCTKREAAAIEKLAKRLTEGNESNLIRRLIKAAAIEQGIEIEGLFEDGTPGNRLPKPKGKGNRVPPTRLHAGTTTAREISPSLVAF